MRGADRAEGLASAVAEESRRDKINIIRELSARIIFVSTRLIIFINNVFMIFNNRYTSQCVI